MEQDQNQSQDGQDNAGEETARSATAGGPSFNADRESTREHLHAKQNAEKRIAERAREAAFAMRIIGFSALIVGGLSIAVLYRSGGILSHGWRPVAVAIAGVALPLTVTWLLTLRLR